MMVPGVPPVHAEVREALRAITSDPDHGIEALSSKRAMESLLKDLLPDRPIEAAILVAAAEHGVAAMLRERVDQEGMDAGTAIRLVTAGFAKATAFTSDACQWAVMELAAVMEMDVGTAPLTVETQPGHGYATYPQPTARPQRRAVWYAAAVAVVVAIAAITIVALRKPALAAPVVAVTAASANNTVGGNVYVYYKVAGLRTATITATVSHASKGQVAELTGQVYPFTAKPMRLAHARITGRYQRLSFQVAPALETRYRIEVHRSASASKALATSPVSTVYVALIAHYKYLRNDCLRPRCFVTIQFRVPVAHAAIQTESAKRVYFYWGINLATSGPEPAKPTRLELQRRIFTTGVPVVLSGGVYQMIVAIKFTVKQDAYRWHWNICTKANVAADGIGLPGPGQCGTDSIAASNPGYLGSLAG